MSPAIEKSRVLSECPSSTTQFLSNWSPNFVQGPCWRSFEQMRTAGGAALENIPVGTVASLHARTGFFRILRDEDFQKLIGLASEVHRIKAGVTIVVQAAKVVAKHPDNDSMELLFRSASLLSESKVLPERDGHDEFQLRPEEIAEQNDFADIDLENIPRAPVTGK